MNLSLLILSFMLYPFARIIYDDLICFRFQTLVIHSPLITEKAVIIDPFQLFLIGRGEGKDLED